jgi:asparagine synthase (glutamine-hydrolysing)
MQHQPVERLVDLLDPGANVFLDTTPEEARAAVRSGDPARVRAIGGHFALVEKEGQTVRLARTLGRPLRTFLAKHRDGPVLVVAERIDEIRRHLDSEGLGDQFHPSYTRMVPAHHLMEIQLVGCPDPSPTYRRFFTPRHDVLPPDLDVIGRAYVGALAEACDRWLETIEPDAPIGVLFSGGVDSGSVFLVLYHLLLRRGSSPARLKAFTLEVGERSADVEQAHAFLDGLDLGMFLEVVEVPCSEVRYEEAIGVIEDYKPLDVQSATMALVLCRGIRRRYPDWVHLADGDGGDENLKDYPIEENPELTIKSVLSNLMLYQEGWGVDAVKHSLVYSGGQSRGHVRSWAPARQLGFRGFSPYALPDVIAVAEGIPFVELTGWDHERLYALKGEVVRRGVETITGLCMPIFAKRRFQHGAVDGAGFASLFPTDEAAYRSAFARLHEARTGAVAR